MGAGPLETTRSIVVSRLSEAPGFFDALITTPSRTDSLNFSLTLSSVRLARCTAVSAASRDSPTTVGIANRSGPRDTEASIRPPLRILLPAEGSVSITAPRGTDSLKLLGEPDVQVGPLGDLARPGPG